MSSVSTSEPDEGFLASEHIIGLLERLRREPALRAWVLTAPTGALATLGVVLDDNELVQLLEKIEALDERAIPVTAADVMTPDPLTLSPEPTVHEAAAPRIRTKRHHRCPLLRLVLPAASQSTVSCRSDTDRSDPSSRPACSRSSGPSRSRRPGSPARRRAHRSPRSSLQRSGGCS